MAISKFKATCLEVLERVRLTRTPIRVTRFGVPVAEVVPPSPPEQDAVGLGALAGTVAFHGDIVGPAIESGDWEVIGE